jgi:hypothetical protein
MCAALATLFVVAPAATDAAARGSNSAGGRGVARASWQQGERLDISLRSFTPRASGQLTIEADASGGRGRLTARNLPDPQTLSRAARTYVVWATHEGRFRRLGELRRDERGNGGLAFTHPAEFERYTVLLTAETGSEPERPAGAPVLSTRAGEARAVYALTTGEEGSPAGRSARAPTAPRGRGSRAQRAAGDFYTEVDDALDAHGGGRALLLEGDALAPRASGDARVAAHTGNGYVRVRFQGVPLPAQIDAGTYAMWAVVPDGRIIYMGSLPASEELNEADIYVRTAGFDADDFELFVTAEARRPALSPSERRALSTREIRSTVK